MERFIGIILFLIFLSAPNLTSAQTPTANEVLCLNAAPVAPSKRISDCSAAILEKPANGKLYEVRAQFYGETKQFDLALADVNKVIQMTPNHDNAYVYRGIVFYTTGKSEAALADFTKALEINPSNTNALYQRAAFYNQTGKKDLALADLRKLSALAPGNPQVAAAIKQLEAAPQPYSYMGKQLAAPEQFLQEVTNLENKNAQSYFGVTMAMPNEKFDPVAFDLLTNCFSRFPEHTGCAKKLYDVYSNEKLRNKSFALTQQAKWVEANLVRLYTTLIKAEPQSHHYYFMRGMQYFYQQKNYPLAVADFTKALEINSSKPSHYYDLRARAYVEQKNYDAALADYATIIAKADNLQARRDRAKVYALQGKYDLALADANQAVESSKGNQINMNAGLYVRAKIYAQAGKHELAIADYSKLIEFDDQSDSAYAERAKSWRAVGKTALATLDEKRVEEIKARRDRSKGKY